VYDVLKMATVGGARANHVSNKAGSLTPGKEADIVLIQADDIGMGPMNNAYGQVVTGASVRHVDTVIIGGKIKKRKGKLVDVNVEKVLKRARASRDRIAATGVGWQPSDLINGRGI
jgi:cytosine/adenosine deaminase-related metal-dependent hydrolase